MNTFFGNIIFTLLCIFWSVNQIECTYSSVFSSAAAAFGAAMYGGWTGLKCHYYECCEQPWLTLDIDKLRNLYKEKLHGQHLVQQVSWKHLQSHWTKKNPSKALVLSFHGFTGTGKNFVSKLIAGSMFKMGTASAYVKLFICTYDFPIHDPDYISIYKRKIQQTVRKLVYSCPYSLIIFDEIDKAPAGILDAIKPMVDYHDSVDGVDYRRATFIFLSNTGGSAISENVYEFWKVGKREEVTLQDLENKIMLGAYNENGGLKGIDVIDKGLISAYIPFLPLERKQVKECIRDSLRARFIRFNEQIVNKIADQMDYFPEDTKAFSKTGCKRVSEKVDLLTADEF